MGTETINTERSDSHSEVDNLIDLHQLLGVIWQGKTTITIITTLFALLFISIALYLNDTYTSSVLLLPQQKDESLMAGMSGQLKDIAGLAGANLGSEASTQTTLGIELLKSRKFLSEFVKKHNILIPLFASDGWDQKSDKLIYDDDIYEMSTKTWTREIKGPQKPIPGDTEIREEFMKHLVVSLGEDTGMVTVSLETDSPKISKQWLEWLIADLNNIIRKKDILQAQKSIKYLESNVAKTHVAEIKNIFFKLIETEQRKMLMAETKDEYVFETIDPAMLAYEKTGPKRALIVIMGTFLGGFLGLLTVFIKFSIKKET